MFPSSPSNIYRKKKSLPFIRALKNGSLNVINFPISSVKISVFQESYHVSMKYTSLQGQSFILLS